jgi:hypothetical protein
VVRDAIFFDGGGTTEMYLPYFRPDRRPEGKAREGWRAQPTCLMIKEESPP